MKFNINNAVTVKLNERGKQILRDDYDQLCKDWPKFGAAVPWEDKWDSEGNYRTQLWSLMQDFGPHVSLGRQVPFDTEIELEVKE